MGEHYNHYNSTKTWRLLSLHAAGKTDREMAEAIGAKKIAHITRWRLRRRLPVRRVEHPVQPTRVATKYNYSRDDMYDLIVRQRRTVAEVCAALRVPRSLVYKYRHEFGVSTPARQALLPPRVERMSLAREMIDERCSFSEIARTAHVDRKTLKRYFNGHQWTNAECIAHALEVRYGEARINEAWSAAGKTQSLTKPPLTH